jgi:hypothetical protein
MDWPQLSSQTVWLLTIASVAMFVGTLIAIPFLIVRLPEDFFLRKPVVGWPTRHPLVHIIIVLGKNVVGYVFLVSGLVMLVLPGQGLLTMFIGFLMIDFPGKRKWERVILSYGPIRRSANWIRTKRGKPPFRFDSE